MSHPEDHPCCYEEHGRLIFDIDNVECDHPRRIEEALKILTDEMNRYQKLGKGEKHHLRKSVYYPDG